MNKLYTYCFLLLCSLPVVAQDYEEITSLNPAFEDYAPPSPDVASLMKFVNYPVGEATGVPQISIPIYSYSGSGVALPISLDYHAGGVRVAEVAMGYGIIVFLII